MEHTPSIPYRAIALVVGVNLFLVGLLALGAPAQAAKKAHVLAPLALPSPQVMFARPIFTTTRTNPTVWGSASDLHGPLTLSVLDSRSGFIYSRVVATTSGPWSVVIGPQLLAGAYKLTLFAGTSTSAQARLQIAVSPPQFERDFSLGRFDVSDGKLMRFKVTGGAQGTSIGQLTLSVAPNSASLDAVTLYGFTDSAYTQPIAAGTDGSIATAPFDPSSPLVALAMVPPLFIPPNKTYYFEIDGTVVPGDTAYSITTQLLGDAWLDESGPFAALATSSNVVWSPNSFGSSTFEDTDWLNGSSIPTLYPYGLAEERYATPTLSCDLSVSTSSIGAPTPVTVSWDSTGADNAAWAGGGVAPLQGSLTVTASSTRTFTLNFWGPLGATQCYTTVYFGQVVAQGGATGTTTATTTPLGTIAASPTSGVAPLTTTLSGTINNNKSCSASTYTLGFGDNSTTTISVAKNLCKSQSYSLSHRYNAAGTYVAKLYLGTFANGTTTPLVATTTITVTATKVGVAPMNLTASIFDAFASAWQTLVSLFARR